AIRSTAARLVRRRRDLIRNVRESEACPRSAGADTDLVRRRTELIILCCALGCALGSGTPQVAAQSAAPDEAASGGQPAATTPSAIVTPTTEFHRTPER